MVGRVAKPDAVRSRAGGPRHMAAAFAQGSRPPELLVAAVRFARPCVAGAGVGEILKWKPLLSWS